MGKLHDISQRWELIENQIEALEYYLLKAPFDQIDSDYVQHFANVRKSITDTRISYQQAKADANVLDQPSNYELGAPQFPRDEF